VVVSWVCRREIASIWELQWGVVWLAPTAIALGSLAGLLGVGLRGLLDRKHHRWLALVIFLFGALLGWGMGGGRQLASWGARGGFAVLVGLMSGGATLLCCPWVARSLDRHPWSIRLGAAGCVVLLELTNHFLWVRQYPAFHLGLGAAALLTAAVLVTPRPNFAAPSTKKPRVWIGLGAIVAMALAWPTANQLAYFDNFRLLMAENAPLLGQAVRVAARLAPPAPFETSRCDRPGGCDRSEPALGKVAKPLDWSGQDLLLVSIDAVRADHVGAYGYRRNTTPSFDRLVREGAVFEQAYCATPHTSYAITSLMTGKYLRPLLLQGAGQDSDTWAGLLRTYGYHTAGFYPPALFFIDAARFVTFRERFLDFEYRKFEFLEGQGRVDQVVAYLASQSADHRVFVWVHLFGPHEPYVAQPGYDFGPRDLDRYDSEIAQADHTAGQLIDAFLSRRPQSVVLMTADHGEEFGDHGGHYHGTTVYEEQVRVPLVVWHPPTVPPHRVKEPVQSIDLLPTVLGALDIPIPPRVRGRDLGALLRSAAPESGPGFAHAETEEQSLLAYDRWRLVCVRQLGACRLYDVAHDPGETLDLARTEPERFSEMRRRLHGLSTSHGKYERAGLMAEGHKWPAAILRGATGDSEAADEIASLLDDADRVVRRKAAELLFQLRRPSTAPALRLTLTRDEDDIVRRWCALALTRLGEGAPLVYELVDGADLTWRRLAALALAEQGDGRGEAALIGWWSDEKARDYTRSTELLEALGRIRSKRALWPLVNSLDDVRLRPVIAATLARIGEKEARGFLAKALAEERYQGARVALARALVELGAGAELGPPLVRFLGVPDPLPGGVGYALSANVLEHIGGPPRRELGQLVRQARVGAKLTVIVPAGGNGSGVRAIVRGRSTAKDPGTVKLGTRLRNNVNNAAEVYKGIPKIDPDRSVVFTLPSASEPVEIVATLPAALGVVAGRSAELVVFASREVELDGLALVPLADELPPPAPQPWQPADSTARP
jgi:HEAT repeat protein